MTDYQKKHAFQGRYDRLCHTRCHIISSEPGGTARIEGGDGGSANRFKQCQETMETTVTETNRKRIAIAWAAESAMGLSHKRNEDSLATDEALGLFLVADGMGGHPAGDVASRTVADSLPAAAKRLLGSHCVADSRLRNILALKEAIGEANRMVREMGNESPELEGMGSTVVACLMVGGTALIAHKGDSRAYLFRHGEIRLLTIDHSVAADLVRSGRATPEQAARLRHGQALTRCVGMDDDVDAEVTRQALLPGDRILLCSDGLNKGLTDLEVADIIGSHDSHEECCRELVEAAVEGGSLDDITVLLLEAGCAGPTA